MAGSHPDPARKLSPNLYDINHCRVYSEKTPDDGQRNCPKHLEFYSKNKFEKLVHLVGFIIRIPRDARSRELKKAIFPHCSSRLVFLTDAQSIICEVRTEYDVTFF